MRCNGAVWLHSVGSATIASRLYRRRTDSVPPHCPVNAGVIASGLRSIWLPAVSRQHPTLKSARPSHALLTSPGLAPLVPRIAVPALFSALAVLPVSIHFTRSAGSGVPSMFPAHARLAGGILISTQGDEVRADRCPLPDAPRPVR